MRPDPRDAWLFEPLGAPRRRTPPWVWWAAGGAVAFAWLCAALAVLCAVGVAKGPPHRVVTGAEVDAKTLAFLRERKLLREGESVQLFYSPAAFDAREEGLFCTERAVVEYRRARRRSRSTRIEYGELAEVRLERSVGAFDDALLHVRALDGGSHVFELPNGDEGDTEFAAAVRAGWRRLDPERALVASKLWFEHDTLPGEARSALEQRGVLAAGERVLALYGWEETSVAEWGTCVTPERLVSYWLREDDDDITSTPLASIEALETRGPEGERALEAIVVRHAEGEYRLAGDPTALWRFEQPLRAAWKAARGR